MHEYQCTSLGALSWYLHPALWAQRRCRDLTVFSIIHLNTSTQYPKVCWILFNVCGFIRANSNLNLLSFSGVHFVKPFIKNQSYSWEKDPVLSLHRHSFKRGDGTCLSLGLPSAQGLTHFFGGEGSSEFWTPKEHIAEVSWCLSEIATYKRWAKSVFMAERVVFACGVLCWIC